MFSLVVIKCVGLYFLVLWCASVCRCRVCWLVFPGVMVCVSLLSSSVLTCGYLCFCVCVCRLEVISVIACVCLI